MLRKVQGRHIRINGVQPVQELRIVTSPLNLEQARLARSTFSFRDVCRAWLASSSDRQFYPVWVPEYSQGVEFPQSPKLVISLLHSDQTPMSKLTSKSAGYEEREEGLSTEHHNPSPKASRFKYNLMRCQRMAGWRASIRVSPIAYGRCGFWILHSYLLESTWLLVAFPVFLQLRLRVEVFHTMATQAVITLSALDIQ